ncbi:MAG: caspase family protein, partial [Desulfobacterales bacterium]|nr:caspase family protein [Desulfobacterales bacterium]
METPISVNEAVAAERRGSVVRVNVKTDGGGTRELEFYGSSHAILIGVSDYTAGWSDLLSIPRELGDVEKILTDQGFKVEKRLNPDGEQLKDIFENFIQAHGYDRDNRLLFYFSGHGHTRQNGEKGYLVPADAPNPKRDE